jgi:hypothetical protein
VSEASWGRKVCCHEKEGWFGALRHIWSLSRSGVADVPVLDHSPACGLVLAQAVLSNHEVTGGGAHPKMHCGDPNVRHELAVGYRI